MDGSWFEEVKETQGRKSCFWFLSPSFHILNTKCLNKLPVCMLNRCLVFAQAVKLTVFALVWTNTKFSFSVNFFQQRASATTSPRSQARDWWGHCTYSCQRTFVKFHNALLVATCAFTIKDPLRHFATQAPKHQTW